MQDPLELTEEEFRKLVRINFMASWFLLKSVGRRMRANNGGGSIVFLTTIIGAGRGLYPGAAAYGACSAGVQQLVRVGTFSGSYFNSVYITFALSFLCIDSKAI